MKPPEEAHLRILKIIEAVPEISKDSCRPPGYQSGQSQLFGQSLTGQGPHQGW